MQFQNNTPQVFPVICLPLGIRGRPRPPRPPLPPPLPPLPPLTGDTFPDMPLEWNLLVGDLVPLAPGEEASGDTGDLSAIVSLPELSTAPSAPSRFKGTHF